MALRYSAPMNATRDPRVPANEPIRLHAHAMENLRFIRETMERSTSFTAVPGWGTASMGLLALAGAALASLAPSESPWLLVWVGAASLAIVTGSVALVRKARLINESLFDGAGRRFALGMLPPVIAGMVLTVVFYPLGLFELMPPMWLLLYGCLLYTSRCV